MSDAVDSCVHRRPRPWWFGWLRGLLFIGLILLAASLVYKALGRAEWNRTLAEARSEGKPVTLAELDAARKVWPENANGARVILDLSDRLAAIQKSLDKADLPIVGMRSSAKSGRPLGQRWDAATDSAVAAKLKEWAPVIARIDRLSEFKGGRFPMELKECPVDILLPSLSPLREASRLKSLEITWRAMHGHTETLPDDVAILFIHGQLIVDEPFLISQLVRVAIDSLTIATIEDVCAQGVVPADRLDAIAHLLVDHDTDYLGPALRGERGAFIGNADYFRIHGELPGYASWQEPIWLPGMQGYLYYDQAAGVRMQNDLVALADKPAEVIAAAQSLGSRFKNLGPFSFTRMCAPSMERACEWMATGIASMRCARVALAAERYRLDAGSFPAKLEVLIPRYIDRIPADPFDGQPLRYRLTSKQACVYSIGGDLTDDGGRVDPSRPSGEKGQDVGFRLLPPDKRGLAPAKSTTQTAPTKETEQLGVR